MSTSVTLTPFTARTTSPAWTRPLSYAGYPGYTSLITTCPEAGCTPKRTPSRASRFFLGMVTSRSDDCSIAGFRPCDSATIARPIDERGSMASVVPKWCANVARRKFRARGRADFVGGSNFKFADLFPHFPGAKWRQSWPAAGAASVGRPSTGRATFWSHLPLRARSARSFVPRTCSHWSTPVGHRAV